MIEIWATPGLNFAIFQCYTLFKASLYYINITFCYFSYPKSGVDKMIRYAHVPMIMNKLICDCSDSSKIGTDIVIFVSEIQVELIVITFVYVHPHISQNQISLWL